MTTAELIAIREQAANADAKKQYRIAYDLESKAKTAEEKAVAIDIYREAALQGNVKAQCRLGTILIYWNGLGKEHARAEGFMWLKKAAAQENGEACATLALCYGEGNSCEQDIAEAARWILLAEAIDKKSGDLNSKLSDILFDIKGDLGIDDDFYEEVEGEQPSMECKEVPPFRYSDYTKPTPPANSNSSSAGGCFKPTAMIVGALCALALVLFLI